MRGTRWCGFAFIWAISYAKIAIKFVKHLHFGVNLFFAVG